MATQDAQLANEAAKMAMRAADEYLRQHGLEEWNLIDCLRASVKARLPEALADTKQAFDAGMGEMAVATFAASMRLAGIEAAKRAAEQAEYQRQLDPVSYEQERRDSRARRGTGSTETTAQETRR